MRHFKLIYFVSISIFMVTAYLVAGTAFARNSAVKELIGTVLYYTPRGEPTVMGIADRDSNVDYSFIIKKETKLEHARKWHDINPGDTVRVVYDEIERGKGGYKLYDRIAIAVIFVRAKEKGQPRREEDSTEGVLVSE